MTFTREYYPQRMGNVEFQERDAERLAVFFRRRRICLYCSKQLGRVELYR